MDDEKRMIETYAIEHSIFIGDKEVLFGVDKGKQYPFLVCCCTYDNPLSVPWPTEGIGTDNYLEAMQVFVNRVQAQIDLTKEAQAKFNFDMSPFTIKHCIPDNKGESIVGKVVVINAEPIRYEYQHSAYQLVFADGGNGALGGRGQAVFGTFLADGHRSRWERYDVLGEIKPEYMPDWAKESLAKIQQQENEKRVTDGRNADMEIRPMTPSERKYAYAQSMQLEGQTGYMGYRSGEFDSSESGIFDHRKHWKTDEFKTEFDNVITALHLDEYGLLKNHSTIREYARRYPDSAFQGNHCMEYGFRVDAEKHAYLIRCNPIKGDYNFHCYCYVSDGLDKHMQRAEQGIRFINPNYKELFRIPDGDKIIVTAEWGEKFEHTCRYIDEYHLEVGTGRGSDLFHICEFAERMERNGATYEPMKTVPQTVKSQKDKEHER